MRYAAWARSAALVAAHAGVLLGLLLLPGGARADCPVRALWPTQDWASRELELATTRLAERQALDRYAFANRGAEGDAARTRTNSLIVMQGGVVLYEREGPGYEPTLRHAMAEVSAAWTSALVGVAVARGALRLDDGICAHLEGVAGDPCGIQVGHLLDAASGLRWLDAADTRALQEQSQPALLYGEGRHDAARFVLQQPLRDTPGSTWHASTGDSTLLASIADRAMRAQGDADWPWRALLDVTGMGRVVVERDAAGNLLGGTQVWASAWDQARLGYLYLNDGCWDGERLLPEGWVASATTVSPSFVKKARPAALGGVPGQLWWVNRAVPEQGRDRPWPRLPDDSYAALGSGGQWLMVIPSADLVVARTARDGPASDFDLETLVLLALALAGS